MSSEGGETTQRAKRRESVGGTEEQEAHDDNGCIVIILHSIFYALCAFSGQLIIDLARKGRPRKKYWLILEICGFIVSTFFLFVFLPLNFGSLLFDLVVIFACPFPQCGFIAIPFIKSMTNVTSFLGDVLPEPKREYLNLQKTAITMATISGTLSYIIMMYVLIVHYSIIHKLIAQIGVCFLKCLQNCGLWQKPHKPEHTIMNPFLDNRNMEAEECDYVPTTLHAQQLFCFCLIFFFNIALLAGNVATLFIIVQAEIDKNNSEYEILDYCGLGAQISSQYCAIISCFVFSKAAYAVTIKCDKMLVKFKEVDIPDIENLNETQQDNIPGQSPYLRELQRRDREYVEITSHSMKPYRFWFAVHWILYAVTAFMAIAYLVETLIQLIYGKGLGSLHYECAKGHNKLCSVILLYIFLFTAEHCILFLYPCFRAASILSARESLIKKVSREKWSYIPDSVKYNFLQYMKEQKCGFKLSILCATIEFGFSIAYISIFVGLLGIIIKVSI